jgi:formylglycine-generating enzyme required for sulfatase activity
MTAPSTLLKAIGHALRNAGGGGEVTGDALPDAAREAWASWSREVAPEQQRAELEALAQAPATEVREAVARAVAEVAEGAPAEVQARLSRSLSEVPGAVRRTLRRPDDPEGRSLPPTVSYAGPDDLLPLLPDRLPRFQPGDRPLPGIDWELEELLGVGGFGEVWKARNPIFDGVPPVALKFCLDPAARDRLLRHEAAVLNQLMRQGKHPGIVALQHTYLSADPPCLEYEFVAGGDLAGLVQEWRRQPAGPDRAARAAGLLLELARIIAFVHRLSPPIVHRDLKPANVLVRARGQGGPGPSSSPLCPYELKVADFGIGGVAANQLIARSRQGTGPGGFLVTALRGSHTPLYASPQQVRGAPPDPRDDVHALGVIWYQLATGNLAAGRPGGTRWTRRLADLGLTAGMVELLGACVEEDPADRPADAAALADRLAALLAPAPAPPGRSATDAAPGESCPVCNGPMKVRQSKYGPFLGCAAYPRCRGTRRMPGSGRGSAPVPRDLPREVTNSVGVRLVLVPAGTFVMGSPDTEAERAADEGPAHKVAIPRPFYLGAFPVTQREYERVMGVNPAHFRDGHGGGPDHPVEGVSWGDAVAFCRRLSALPAEREAKRTYRLPTEAEWEHACRAGTATPFSCGPSLSGAQANFDAGRPYGGAAPQPLRGKTTAVGSYGPNPWGLGDMHGNVWEWCADWYAERYYRLAPEADPQGPPQGDRRVVRGGAWNNSGHLGRSARRNKYAPDFRTDTIGFRVVLEV